MLPHETPHGLATGVLRPGEFVTSHWAAPGGRGLLTTQRILLLGHPHPIHRPVEWAIDLDQVKQLVVERMGGDGEGHFVDRGALGGGVVTTTTIDPTFFVQVDETVVFIGSPNPCAELQRRIDEARTERCRSLFGRLIPYQPGSLGGGGNAGGPTPGTAPARLVAPVALFVLFVSGVPYRTVPGARNPMAFSVGYGGTALGSDRYGGHEPADADPRQIFGEQAGMGRMVLDIARRRGVPVKVVDVERSGSDAGLVARWVTPTDELPMLVRPDGARLAGSESMTPEKVSRFLEGR